MASKRLWGMRRAGITRQIGTSRSLAGVLLNIGTRYKRAHKQPRGYGSSPQLSKSFRKERREHPSFSTKQIRTIVRDHSKKKTLMAKAERHTLSRAKWF